jgi:hypothetical protein
MDFYIAKVGSRDVLRCGVRVAPIFRCRAGQFRAGAHCLPTGGELPQRSATKRSISDKDIEETVG